MHWIERLEVAAYYQLLKEDDAKAIRFTEDNIIDLTRLQVKHIDLKRQTINYPSLQSEGKLMPITIKNKRIISYLKIVFEYRRSQNDYVFRKRR